MRRVRKEIIVIECDNSVRIGHNARINGQMADGSQTWEFDEMDEDGVYLANRGTSLGLGDNRLYLVRQ